MSKKTKIIWGIVVLVVLCAVWFLFIKKDNSSDANKITVKRDSIAEIVRITGKVVPAKDANLGFESSGKVSAIYADVGDTVYAGQTIAVLDTEQLYAELQSVEAQLQSDKASYDSVINGARPEEISISRSKVANYSSNLNDSITQLSDKIFDGYTKTDDAINNKIDQFITNPKTQPELDFTISDFALEQKIKSERYQLNAVLVDFDTYAHTKLTPENALTVSADAKKAMNRINLFLNNIATAVNSLSASSGLTQTTIDGYKTDVLSARTNMNTALSALSSAEEKVQTAVNTLAIAKQDLDLLLAGSTEEQKRIALANIKKSEAAVSKIKVQIQKSKIMSPINGVISKQDAKVGEVVSANTVLASVISENGLLLEAQIPEVDIGRVKVGNKVRITIDAFAGTEFEGRVTYIEPAETIIDGVVNFKSNISITNPPENIRSGLTSNLFIETNSKEDTLVIPQYAVLEKDEGTFVVMDIDGVKTEVKVTLGLRGEGGILEVLSGIKEGDVIYNVGLKDN